MIVPKNTTVCIYDSHVVFYRVEQDEEKNQYFTREIIFLLTKSPCLNRLLRDRAILVILFIFSDGTRIV